VRNPSQSLCRLVKKIIYWENNKPDNLTDEEYCQELNKMWNDKRILLAQLKK
jgi:hypothetical protein